MEYWWEGSSSTAMPPFASDSMSQRNKVGSVSFRAALLIAFFSFSFFFPPPNFHVYSIGVINLSMPWKYAGLFATSCNNNDIIQK